MASKAARMPAAPSLHSAGIFADMSVDGPEIGTLVVVMDRAKNLPNLKTMGKQDPYAAARLGKEAKKTSTDRRGGQTPRWDQELRFTVHDALDYHKLKVSVFNDDKRTDLIGECWVQLEEILERGGGQSDAWHPLNCKGRYAGDIRIELTFYDSRPKPERGSKARQTSAETDSLETKGQSNQTEDQTDARLSGPRDLPPVRRRPLPAPTSSTTQLTETNDHTQSTTSLPAPLPSSWDIPKEPRHVSIPVADIDSRTRPISMIVGSSVNPLAPYSAPLPEPIGYNSAGPHQGFREHYEPGDFLHEPPQRRHSFADYPEVYEDPEPYAEFTDDPYALQAIYASHEATEQSREGYPPDQDFPPRHDRVHALSGGVLPPSAPMHPSHLTPGHLRNAYSEAHTGLDMNDQADHHLSPVHPRPQRPFYPPDASSLDYEQYQMESPTTDIPDSSPLPPAPPRHRGSHDNTRHERRQPQPHHYGSGYADQVVPTNPGPSSFDGPISHRQSYSNLPDEFGRNGMTHDLTYFQQLERRHSGDAVSNNQYSAEQTSGYGVGSRDQGFYPAPRHESAPVYRHDTRPHGSNRLAQTAAPRPNFQQRQAGPKSLYQPRDAAAPFERSGAQFRSAHVPSAAQHRTAPVHQHHGLTQQQARVQHQAQQQQQFRPQYATPQTRPQQSFVTPRKAVSPNASVGSATPESSVPFSPDAYHSFNPRAAETQASESSNPAAYQAPSPMYSSPATSNNASPAPAAQQSPSQLDSKRTPSGRVVTSSGRVIDPSDHIPSTAWAPEPELKNNKRPAVQVNVKNRFGPRQHNSPQSTPPGTSLPSAGGSASAGGLNVRVNKMQRGAPGRDDRTNPLGPADQNARFTTHGIAYKPVIPPKIPMDAGPAETLAEEMRNIEIGPSPLQAVEHRWGGAGTGSRPRRSRFGA